MSLLCTCDNCGQSMGQTPKIEVKGVAPKLYGLLLPHSCQVAHFCSLDCFGRWAREMAPALIKQEGKS